MAFKFVAALALVAVASAGYIQPEQHVYQQAVPVEHTVAVAPAHHVLAKNVEEFDHHPQYKYSYDVQDHITGDSKSQSETRNGDAVEGEYSLIDADGYKRIVHYTADDEHGFNAVVSRVPLHGAHEPSAAVVKAAPVAYATPAVVKTVAPVAYAAPSYYKSAPVSYAAPAVVKSVGPAVYSAPALYKSAPVAYASPSYYKSDSFAYAAPAVAKSVSLGSYSTPTYYKSAPVAHVAQPVYVNAPQTYSVPSAYANSVSSEHSYNH